MEKKRLFNSQNHMNKPVRMFGLTSMQFFLIAAAMGLLMVVMSTLVQAGFLVTMVTLGVLALPLTFAISKLRKEQEKGNPNYIQSMLAFGVTPKKIEDQNRVLQGIVKRK